MTQQSDRRGHDHGHEQCNRNDVSYSHSLQRFSKSDVADEYPSRYRNTWRDRREVSGIRRSLRDVPQNSRVLDLPCGSGRLLELLLAAGHSVTCADSSPSMVELARARWQEIRAQAKPTFREPRFFVRNVLQTEFDDDEFDAVICNRLFHHFAESQTRVQALKELARVSKGPVAVSFFNSFALDALRFRLKNWLRRKTPKDRIPIPMAGFLDDFHQAGLEVVETFPLVWGISPMWYVVGRRSAAATRSIRKAA